MQAYGQLTNSTLSVIPDPFWQFDVADAIGWLIGIAGIAIALLIFIRQQRTQEKVEKLQKAIIANPLNRIVFRLNHIKDYLNDVITRSEKSDTPLTIDHIDHLMEYDGWIFNNARSVIEENAHFLRHYIHPSLFGIFMSTLDKIDDVVHYEEMRSLGNCAPANWLAKAKTLTEHIQEVIETINGHKKELGLS